MSMLYDYELARARSLSLHRHQAIVERHRLIWRRRFAVLAIPGVLCLARFLTYEISYHHPVWGVVGFLLVLPYAMTWGPR